MVENVSGPKSHKKNPGEAPGFPIITKWINLPYTILSRFLNTSDITNWLY
jgi:hypothetical protein